MADQLLEMVEKLQSRLSENQEPRKCGASQFTFAPTLSLSLCVQLLKTLRRLEVLPMTVDILVETGVGKAVNSLRKHEVVGEVAKNLVAKWKTLVPQPVVRWVREGRPGDGKEVRSHTRRSDGGNRVHKRPRDPSPEQPHYIGGEEEQEEEEEEIEEQEQEEEEADSGYRPSYSLSPPQHHYSPLQGGYQSEGYESPPEDGPVPSPPRKEVKHMKQHKDRESERRRHHADHSRRAHSGSVSCTDGKKRAAAESERQASATHRSSKHSRHSTPHGEREGKKEKDKKGLGEGKCRVCACEFDWFGAVRGHILSVSRGAAEVRDAGSGAVLPDPKKAVVGPFFSAPGRSQERRSNPEVAQRGHDEEEEAFEAPTMSFESFLTYDAPTSSKKKKKKPPRLAQCSQPTPAAGPSIPTKSSKSNGTCSKRPEPPAAPTPAAPAPTAPVAEKRQKVIDEVPMLPDIPLPAIQPNYRPLPSIDITPLSPQRRKVPVSCDEEDAGFSGRRLNTKTGVYSGSKTTYLPKMMTLYEQCIRVLQNNIDSIDEVGGVPFEILEPVLERCTPEQLFRIEQYNQVQHTRTLTDTTEQYNQCFMEETDELWMRHCRRDFKHESPQEYESWREMYLRLYDEREERLRTLTQNISSAHAQRPKGACVPFVSAPVSPPTKCVLECEVDPSVVSCCTGRQVKMAYVNSVVKPPRDVRRRQEKFGTASGSGGGGGGGGGSGSSSSHSPVR
ncbi:transcription elongation factor B polypeptide 3-like [Scleropages formosus]|uniref:Transcription elongation factor B polypeptide 3-like n=1 Tax=Scleropages formosus TaxID=113540 RepID=A0A0P7WCM9_SCLFO|nr:transcription elongation factor B polypeptide 3-like [Scleropages formosus]